MTKKAAVGIIAIDQKDEKEMAMKRKKPDYFQGRKRLRSTLLLTMVGIFLLGAISFQLLVQQITRSFETNIQKEVIEISRQNAETVRRELTAKQQFMLAIAEDFSNGSRQTKEQILAHLRSYAPLYQFYNMGVIESDGTGYTLDGMKLVAKYGYVGLAVEQKEFVVEGLNEVGLSAGLFYFPGYGKYEAYDESRKQQCVTDFQLVSWILGTCATVDEVKRTVPQALIVAIDPRASTVHWRFADASGNQIVLEIMDGKPMSRSGGSVGRFTGN